MTVRNGPSTALVVAQKVAYNYDDADRLITITQLAGLVNNNVAQTVSFAYDDANRLTSQTQTGGVVTACTYTDADEIKSITYRKADGTIIASGAYTYDAAGRRNSVSGDLATFVQASGPDVTDAVYNVNNQLTTWRGKTFAYDKNGQLTNDGVSIYAWDARGQLSGISGGSTATFQYDSQGRRLAKTVAGAMTGFAYDDSNFVQELSGLGSSATVNANLLTGDVDHVFFRTTGTSSAATTRWFLAEANNNTVMTTDGADAAQKSYAYEAYGSTTPGAGTDANTQQYTGRENDGSGLYYYRDRYYMPSCMRFISEDPIGWASGQTNNYAYVGGNPVQVTDPSGDFGLLGAAIGAGANLAWQLYQNGGNLSCVNVAEVAAWGLTGSGVGIIGGAVARGGLAVAGSFFWDTTAFRGISSAYWGARGGAAGMSLDHWAIGQAVGRDLGLPSGLVNGGWNLLEMPMALNRWLGFAPRWGGAQAAAANAARVGIQAGVPSLAAAAGYGGYQLGTAAQSGGSGGCQ